MVNNLSHSSSYLISLKKYVTPGLSLWYHNPVKSEEKIAELVAHLAELTPGYYPGPIFQQFSRLTVNPIIEIVPLRKRPDSQLEVLLLERDVDDPIFPGELHTPGTVIRPSDSSGSFKDAFERILEDELSGLKTKPPVFVQNIFHHSGRGMESSQIFWTEVLEEPKVGRFYEVDRLPERLMASQLDFIPIAIDHYLVNSSN